MITFHQYFHHLLAQAGEAAAAAVEAAAQLNKEEQVEIIQEVNMVGQEQQQVLMDHRQLFQVAAEVEIALLEQTLNHLLIHQEAHLEQERLQEVLVKAVELLQTIHKVEEALVQIKLVLLDRQIQVVVAEAAARVVLFKVRPLMVVLVDLA